MKRFLRKILFVVMTMVLILIRETEDCLAAKDALPDLYAACAVLMDGASGRVLCGKSQESPMANASTTKIMTCILVLENCEISEEVTISAYAQSMPKVNAGLRKGERYLVEDLLYSMMLESHNDSAVALAEHVGRKAIPDLSERDEATFSLEESALAVKAFSVKMNSKAAEIGCRDTYFITPNGLDATETRRLSETLTEEKMHHTTARDLALILAYCTWMSPKRDLFQQITGTREHTVSRGERRFTCFNHNAFLDQMEGAISGKTGFTGKAGYCYVGALERDGKRLVVALLACGWPNNRGYKWQDTRKLMAYGLEQFHSVALPEAETLLQGGEVPVVNVRDGQTKEIGDIAGLVAAVERTKQRREKKSILLGRDEKLEIHIALPEELEAPVSRGQRIGELRYQVGDEVIDSLALVASDDILRVDFYWCLDRVLALFGKGADFRAFF